MGDFWDQPVEMLFFGTKEARALELLDVKTFRDFAQLDLEKVLDLRGYGTTTHKRLQSHQKRLLRHGDSPNQAEAGHSEDEIAFDVVLRTTSARTRHTLEGLGVVSVQGLVRLKDEQVLDCRGAGTGVLAEIKRIQRQYEHVLQQGTDLTSTPASKESIEYLPLFSNTLLDISDIDLHESYLPYMQFRDISFPGWLLPYLNRIPVRTLGELLLLPGKSLLELEGCGQKKLEQLRGIVRAHLRISLLGHYSHATEASLEGLSTFPLYTGTANGKIHRDNIHSSYHPRKKLQVLKLPARATSLYRSLGITTIADLLLTDPSLLLAQINFGQTTLEATRQALADYILHRPELPNLTTNSRSLQEIISKFFHEVLSERLRKVMLLRLGLQEDSPLTLLGVAKRLRLTRERVRQIQIQAEAEASSPENLGLLQDLRCMVREIITRLGGRVSLRELAHNLESRCMWESGCPPRLLRFTVDLFHEYECYEDAVSIPDFPCSYCDVPGSAIEEVMAKQTEIPALSLSSRIARHCNDRYCKVFVNNSIKLSDSFISAYIAKRMSLRNSYVAHEGAIRHLEHHLIKHGTKQEAVECILKLHARPLHFTEVASIYEQYCPGSTFSGQSAHAALNNAANAVLWDRGTFIHGDYVHRDVDFIADISRWIVQRLSNNCAFISIAAVYSNFRSRCRELGIHSETALYSYLRRERTTDYYLNRYPLVTLTGDRVSITQVLEEYVLERGGDVSKSELRLLLERHGFKDASLGNMLANAPGLLHADNGRVVHVDALNIKPQEILEICEHAQRLLANSNTISAGKVYRDKRISCKLLGLTGPRLLFSCLQIFGGGYLVTGRYPQLRGLDKVGTEGLGIRRELEGYVKRHAPCTYDQLREHFVESCGYDDSSLDSVLYYSQDIIRYAPRCYIHESSLGWTEIEYGVLLGLLHDVCEQHAKQLRYASLKEVFDYHYSCLPQLPEGLPWTFTLLQNLAGRFTQIRFVGNARNAYIATSDGSPGLSLSAVIQDLLMREYDGAALKEELETRLVQEGIIMKTLTPTMLEDADGVVLRGKHVIVRDLTADV